MSKSEVERWREVPARVRRNIIDWMSGYELENDVLTDGAVDIAAAVLREIASRPPKRGKRK